MSYAFEAVGAPLFSKQRKYTHFYEKQAKLNQISFFNNEISLKLLHVFFYKKPFYKKPRATEAKKLRN